MPFLTSDLHLTENSIDEYRWGIFPVLKRLIKTAPVDDREIYILGDLTDSKDKHSSLVNRVVDSLVGLTRCGASIYILAGNHDYIDSATPYFRFLRHIPSLHFYTVPECVGNVLLVPHQRDFSVGWAEAKKYLSRAKVILMHQTMAGVKVNSIELDGVDSKYFSSVKVPIYSGDIHIPHTLGKVTYVGSPYQVRFGDSYTPRILHVKGDKWGKPNSINTNFLRRWSVTITSPKQLLKVPLAEHDQIKVKLELTKQTFSEWEQLRQSIVRIVKRRKAELVGLSVDTRQVFSHGVNNNLVVGSVASTESPASILREYCKTKQLDETLLDLGLSIIDKLPAESVT